jgi:hypothetical protein
MAKSLEIPQDIIDSIIAEVGDDTDLLKQCSLVSSSFLLPSRKHLFSRITLRSEQTCHGIYLILTQNPVIQSFVRAINLTGDIPNRGFRNYTWMDSASLSAILRLPFCCLEYFSINVSPEHWIVEPLNWNCVSSELKDAISNIIHSSNLKTLSLEGVAQLPITFFLDIVRLKTLELYSVSPSGFRNYYSSSLTPAASKGVAPMASHPVIDRCVWHLNDRDVYSTKFALSAYFPLIQDIKGPPKSIFLPFMCRLRIFEIYAYLVDASMEEFDIWSSVMDSLCMSITSPATLEHLKFNICFHGNTKNDFDNHKFYEDLRNVWSHLDSITTHPTGSRLQQVDININYTFRFEDGYDNDSYDDPDYVREPDEGEVLKAIYDGLPLLHAKGILFVKATLDG